MTSPQPPRLTYAFTIAATIDRPRHGGHGPLGTRLHIAILGGTVDGPRLRGRVLPGGSDWPLLRADGHSVIDAHYTIEAEDGTPIRVHSQGLRVSSTEVAVRLREGEFVNADELYFRAQPRFEAPCDSRHAWLNDRLFIANLVRRQQGVDVQVFTVE